MIDQVKVNPIVLEGEEVSDNGDDVRNVHDEDGVRTPHLIGMFTYSSYPQPEIAYSDKATNESEEAVGHVHGKTNVLVPRFYNEQIGICTSFLTRYSPQKQKATVSQHHIERVTHKVCFDPFEFEPIERPDDFNHASNSHQGNCDLRNASQSATEKLRSLV